MVCIGVGLMQPGSGCTFQQGRADSPRRRPCIQCPNTCGKGSPGRRWSWLARTCPARTRSTPEPRRTRPPCRSRTTGMSARQRCSVGTSRCRPCTSRTGSTGPAWSRRNQESTAGNHPRVKGSCNRLQTACTCPLDTLSRHSYLHTSTDQPRTGCSWSSRSSR